jgi:hypothetical protein
MENPSKCYQVAYSYYDYHKSSTGQPKNEFKPLPSCIPEEENSTWQIRESKPENIFHHHG